MRMRLLVTGASGFIGTNLIAFYSARDCELLNVDIRAPLAQHQINVWKRGDIMNPVELEAIFAEFRPTCVVHMAARTDCDEDTTVEEGYEVNTTGTRNVLNAIRKTRSVRRVIIVSSQYVAGPSRLPANDLDYFPHTVYGESKVITEQLAWQANLDSIWTLVRPTNIWGPWHMRYRREAWRVIKRGLYLHPSGKPVLRTYGYVGNIIWQINEILNAKEGAVHRQVFNLGDRPSDIYEWVNAFAIALRGKAAIRAPRCFLAFIARIGDALAILGKTFPITSSRYKNMTSDYPTSTDRIFEVFGDPPYSLREGVDETVRWLEEVGWE